MSFATIYLNPNLINTDEEHFKKLSISSISVSFRLLMVFYRKLFLPVCNHFFNSTYRFKIFKFHKKISYLLVAVQGLFTHPVYDEKGAIL